MPTPDIASILENTAVQAAIANIIREAALNAGIQKAHADRMAIGARDRIATGKPVPAAIDLVERLLDVTGWPNLSPRDPSMWQEDTRKLLLALGLGDHARPESCHDVVVGEILPAIEALVARAAKVPA